MVSKYLHNLTSNDMRSILGGKKPVVIAGSGISAWEPTQLPTGQEFSEGVREALFKTSGHPDIPSYDWRLLDKLINDVPFEMIMERCPDQGKIGRFLSHLYSGSQPNPIHLALAELAKRDIIHSIITTNYDLGLDLALIGGPLHKIVYSTDLSNPSMRVYFKVHGSADDVGSMVYSLTHESEMIDWKRLVMSNCIKGRPVILIGYSGFDFEVCPELCRCSSSVILWNFFSESDRNRSPGLYHINRSSIPKVVLIGDMLDLLRILGFQVSARRAVGGNYDVADMLRSEFHTDILLLWRVRLLATIGYPRLALHSIEPFSPWTSADADVVLEHAQALFHKGEYLHGAKEYLRAGGLSADTRFQLLRKLDASDALRCYGDFKASENLIQEVMVEAKKFGYLDVIGRTILKKMLIIHIRYEISRKLLFGWGAIKLKQKAQQLIQQGAPIALQQGSWLDFQQFGLWAERLGLPSGDLHKQGGFEPLPTRYGYRHLGYYIPLLMELYDRARKSANGPTEQEISEGFTDASQLGCNPVAWKIAKIAMRLFPSHSAIWLNRYRDHFSLCEYNWKQRLIYHLAWR